MLNGETRRLHTFGPNWYPHEGVWTRDGKGAVFHMTGDCHLDNEDPDRKYEKLYGLRSDSAEVRLLMVYEKPLPEGGRVDIWTIGVSDDGRYAVAAGIHHPRGGWFSIVDVAAGKEHASMAVKGETVFKAVAFSPDSRWLYVGGTMGRLYRVSVETGEIEGHTYIGKSPKSRFGHRLMEIAVSPDGSVVAAGSGPKGEIYFWDAVTLERITTLWTKDGTTLGMVFSPDGTKLATYGAHCEDGIRIWDVSFLAGRKREAGQ
jgi:WD40 repeat protein